MPDVAEVHAWQRHYGMEPRDDSKLTGLYASGQLCGMGPDEVARELVATDALYQTTLYGEVIEDVLRGMADRLRREHPGLTWTQTWTLVRFYGPIALKLLCCLRCPMTVPQCG